MYTELAKDETPMTRRGAATILGPFAAATHAKMAETDPAAAIAIVKVRKKILKSRKRILSFRMRLFRFSTFSQTMIKILCVSSRLLPALKSPVF